MKVFLILGAAVRADGPSPAMRRRVAHALALWRRDTDAMLLPCGGLGVHPPTEAEVMRDLLLRAGVPADRIRCETRSTSTLENIRFAAPVLAEMGATHIVIVSDRYHLPRALAVARHLGLRATADGPPWDGRRPLLRLRQNLREAAARGLYRLRRARD